MSRMELSEGGEYLMLATIKRIEVLTDIQGHT